MLKQLSSCALVALTSLSAYAASDADLGTNAFSEPAPTYLLQFAQKGGQVLVLERYASDGRLAERSAEKITGEISIDGAIDRTVAGRKIRLRGLIGCPTEKVIYNARQTWKCQDAARDYAGTIYNQRASVILCKTLLLSDASADPIPASCFLLVGGDGEPFRTVNDDDSMVFLGLAGIAYMPDGRSRRLDLEGTQALSKSMGFQDAD